MSQTNVQDIVKHVSADEGLKEQLLGALATLSRENSGFKQELLNTLDAPSGDEKKKERWSLFSTIKKEAVFQVVLTGILSVLFILFVFLTFKQLTTKPEDIAISGGHMEMYDPFTWAKDILTLILPLFTTVLSFWLGFSVQEKKVDQAESTANKQREMREKADTMMAKIEGRMMTMPENDDIENLSNDIHKILESLRAAMQTSLSMVFTSAAPQQQTDRT